MKVTICGAGNTGHLYTGLMSGYPGVDVSLFTRKAKKVRDGLGNDGIAVNHPDGSITRGRPSVVSDDPREAVHDADVVIITEPAHIRGTILKQIAAHLPRSKPVYVGAIPGFCGFDLNAADALSDQENVVIWGMKDVPYMAYAPVPGVSSVMGGPKSILYVGLHDRHSEHERTSCIAALQQLFPAEIKPLNTYRHITLTPGNPIMHPSILYGLIGPYSQWDGRGFQRQIPWWSEAGELGTYFMTRCDQEMVELRAAYGLLGVDLSDVDGIHSEIVAAYGEQIADPRTLLSTLRTNKAYASALIPMQRTADGWFVDTKSRAFLEDVPHGLSLLVGIGKALGVPTPMMSEIESWALGLMEQDDRHGPNYVEQLVA